MRFGLALLLLSSSGAASAAEPHTMPTVEEVRRFAEWQVLRPYVWELPGRRVIEFGPDVETRSIACSVVAEGGGDCSYEVRWRDFATEFTEWRQEKVRLVWRDGCWQAAS